MRGDIESEEFTDRIRSVRDALLTGLVERDAAVRLALLAALAGEHLLLLGPAGTAKSLIARRLKLAFSESEYFERLLTRFTVPEELFGPLSIKGLEQDRYERLTDRYLPRASIAFLDEIFKANSAILNSLLTLLNEREFDNGTERVKTPLVAVVGASNELPDGEELNALYDRFLLRLHVGPVSGAAFPDLLGLRGESTPEVADELRLSTEDLATLRTTAQGVEVPKDVEALLCELREWCTAEKIQVSDRRWRKIVRLLQVAALTNGRGRVSVWDCWLLQHCLWDKPEHRAKVYDWYAARVGATAAMDPSRLTRLVTSWEAQLKSDKNSRSQRRDEQGRRLFEAPDGAPTLSARGDVQRMRADERLFLAPANAYDDRGYRPVDRANEGRGYTEDELDELSVGSGGALFRHWKKRAAYVADRSNWLVEAGDLPPLMEPTRQKPVHVAHSLREIAELRVDIERYQAELAAHQESLETQIKSHLWVTADFAGPASESLAQTRGQVAALLTRVDALGRGFELLPQETEPVPIAAGDGDADMVEAVDYLQSLEAASDPDPRPDSPGKE